MIRNLKFRKVPLPLIMIALAFVVGCQQKPPTDKVLSTDFSSNKESFFLLSKAYDAGHVVCSDAGDPDICSLEDSTAVVDELRRRAHVEAAYVKKAHSKDDGIWLPVQTYGVMSTSSSSRGYVFLRHPPSASVKDTLDVDAKGSYYKALAGGWYLFVQN
jgi:hypothetical protein